MEVDPPADPQARLGCGRSVDDVWDHVRRSPDPHERGCEFCTDARRALGPLAAITDDLRAAEEADSTLQIGPAVKAAVMAVARAEVRRARLMPLEAPDAGRVEAAITVSEQAVAATVRAAVDALPDVQARRCHVELDKQRLLDAHLAGDQPAGVGAALHLTIQVVASAHTALPDLAQQIRRAVEVSVTRHLGMRVSAVDVVVEDLFDA